MADRPRGIALLSSRVAEFARTGAKAVFTVKRSCIASIATELDTVDREFGCLLTVERIRAIVSLIPDNWLMDESSSESAAEKRQVYTRFLETRLAFSETFVKDAQHAREALI